MKRLNERDNRKPRTDEVRTVLHQRPGRVEGVTRHWPSPALGRFVEHYWIVRWDVPEPVVVEVAPQPTVHLVIESGVGEVVGVSRTRFTRTLRGRGRLLGAKFRAGAFRPFLRAPVSSLSGRRVPLAEQFGAPAKSLERRVREQDDDREAVDAVEAFLLALDPRVDDDLERVGHLVSRIESDRGVTRVDQLATEFGLGARSLQRLFREHVGASPKRVILCCRLLDAAFRASSERDLDWSDLALELGFADQAHFIREFRKLVGVSPAAYARQLDASDGTSR